MRHTYLIAVVVGLASFSASAVTFPDAGAWQPVSINAPDGGVVYLGDALGDGQNNGRDIVGDNTRPAFFIASSTTHFFFRLRLDASPSGPGGLASYGWGILIDADGDVRDYDYVLMANGIGETIDFSRKTTKTLASDPSELADVLLNSTPTSYTQPTQNIVITAVGAGASGFGGNEDYFLDMAVPLSVFYGTNPDGGAYLNFSPSTVLRFWVGISNSSRSITLDIGGTTASPGAGTLIGTVSTPQLLCQADPECGSTTSGQVCVNGACGAGCRGTGGNGCSASLTCTSTTSAVGQCISSGAPVVMTPANQSASSVKTPVISGTSPASALITIYVDGVMVGTTTATALGAWTYTSATLSDGVHTASATATVGTVVSGLSNVTTFSIDSTAPTAPTVVFPASGGSTNTATPTVSGLADPGTTVRIYVDGNLIGTTTALNDGTYSFTLPVSLGAGSHTVRVDSTDAVGNVSVSSNTNTFTVDTTAPQAPVVTAPADGNITSNPSPTITGTAEAGSVVTVIVNGSILGTTTATPQGDWSFVVPQTLTDGSYTVRATATDAASNVSSPSTTNTFTVRTLAPPAPALTGPVDGSSSTDDTPTFSGTSEPGATVTVRVDGVIVCTATAASDGAFSCTPSQPLAEGAHVATASSANSVGSSAESAPTRLSIDVTPPLTPFIVSPASGSNTSDTTPTISGRGEPGSLVAVFIDGQRAGEVTVSADGSWTFEAPTALSLGDHQVTARATDPAGNQSLPSNTNAFSVVAPNASRPVLDAPMDNGSIATTQPAFSGQAAPGAMVTVLVDGQAVCTATATVTGAWTCTGTQALSQGLHRAVAEASDALGGPLSSETHSFTVDTVAPSAPVVSGPVNGSLTSDTTPVLEGTAEPLTVVKVFVDGLLVGSVTAGLDGRWSLTSGVLSLGAHAVTATATDRAGNTSALSTPSNFTITAPSSVPVVLGPTPGTVTSDATPVFSGTSDPGATVEVRVDGALVCTATASVSGAWSCAATTPLADGPHSVDARVQGSSTSSTSMPFGVDTVAPAAPVVTSPTANSFTSATPTLAGTAEPGARVEVKVDGVAVCVTLADAQGQWDCVPPTPLADGAHQVTATATDVAGNRSPPSAPAPFVVDLIAPSAPTLTEPAASSTTTDPTPRFSGTAEPSSTVTVRVDGTTTCTTQADTQGAWSCEAMQALPRGDHTASATATDGAGNTSAPSGVNDFTVVAVTPVTPTITGPAQEALLNDTTPTLSGSAPAGSTVTVRDASTMVVLCTATADAQGQWSCEATVMAEGTHAIVATAEQDGGTSLPSSPTTFRIDATPPVVTVTPPKPVAGTPGITFTWVPEPETTYQCSIDGGAFQECHSPLTLTGLAPGVHTITVRATDAAGNTYETTTTWVVEEPRFDVLGGGISCAALPGETLVPLALVLLALRRRRPKQRRGPRG